MNRKPNKLDPLASIVLTTAFFHKDTAEQSAEKR